MVKIRLSRYGRRHLPHYRIVAVDSRVKRDGGYVELLGTYNPLRNHVDLKVDSIVKWLSCGAQPTDTVRAIFKKDKELIDFFSKKDLHKSTKELAK